MPINLERTPERYDRPVPRPTPLGQRYSGLPGRLNQRRQLEQALEAYKGMSDLALVSLVNAIQRWGCGEKELIGFVVWMHKGKVLHNITNETKSHMNGRMVVRTSIPPAARKDSPLDVHYDYSYSMGQSFWSISSAYSSVPSTCQAIVHVHKIWIDWLIAWLNNPNYLENEESQAEEFQASDSPEQPTSSIPYVSVGSTWTTTAPSTTWTTIEPTGWRSNPVNVDFHEAEYPDGGEEGEERT